MDAFDVTITTTAEQYRFQIEPTDNNGLLQYVVTGMDDESAVFQEAWWAVLEREAGGWRQAPESIEGGRRLLPFLLKEIGEAIDRQIH